MRPRRALAVRWRERSRRPLALHYHGVMVYPYAKIPPPGGLRLQNVQNSKIVPGHNFGVFEAADALRLQNVKRSTSTTSTCKISKSPPTLGTVSAPRRPILCLGFNARANPIA